MRAWAPAADQLAAPLVPYSALFLVPVALARLPGGAEQREQRERPGGR